MEGLKALIFHDRRLYPMSKAKSIIFSVRLSEDEYKRLRAQAEAVGMTLGAFMRAKALKEDCSNG